MISIAYRADCESGQKIKNLSEVHLFITPWNSEAKFVKKTFLISKWVGLDLGFEIKKVFLTNFVCEFFIFSLVFLRYN